VTVWGDYAEHVAESLTAGARVVVAGRTGTRVWTPTEGERAGQEQRRLEVVADEVAPSLRWATAKVAKVERRDGDAPVEDEPPF
jgi:single-strand DNA-binding protein